MDFDTLSIHLAQLTDINAQQLTEEQLTAHRKRILKLSKQCQEALGKTSTKEHDYDDAEVMHYVQDILEAGYSLKQTKLSANPNLIEAQHLTWWKHIIKACVQQSPFSEQSFKIDSLSVQRSAIEHSSTLHELRQNVRAMIGPLKMHRELTNKQDKISYEVATYEQLLEENERLRLELEEKTRMLSEITKLYDEPLKGKKDKLDILKAVDEYKNEHSCSDDDACRFFDISRSTLKRMRKDVQS
jgi:hypothetical protein